MSGWRFLLERVKLKQCPGEIRCRRLRDVRKLVLRRPDASASGKQQDLLNHPWFHGERRASN